MKRKELHLADVAEIQEAVNDDLQKVQKEEFSAAFQKLYDRAKACTYANGASFELKKGMCLPHASSIFKKISPKTFGPHCVFSFSNLSLECCAVCEISRTNIVDPNRPQITIWRMRAAFRT
jgi:hypothetical protein